jgi:hypothetical protein
VIIETEQGIFDGNVSEERWLLLHKDDSNSLGRYDSSIRLALSGKDVEER